LCALVFVALPLWTWSLWLCLCGLGLCGPFWAFALDFVALPLWASPRAQPEAQSQSPGLSPRHFVGLCLLWTLWLCGFVPRAGPWTLWALALRLLWTLALWAFAFFGLCGFSKATKSKAKRPTKPKSTEGFLGFAVGKAKAHKAHKVQAKAHTKSTAAQSHRHPPPKSQPKHATWNHWDNRIRTYA